MSHNTAIPDSSSSPHAERAQIEVKPGLHAHPPHGALPRLGPTRVPRAVIITAVSTLALSAVWAFWPMRISPELDANAGSEERMPNADSPPSVPLWLRASVSALDPDAFRVPIWVTPPPPAPPPPPIAQAPPPPPLTLQLLAITRDGDGPAGSTPIYRATLYDPTSDRLFIVASGDTLGARRVERVTDRAIALTGPDGQHTLTLAAAPSTAGGPR